MIALAHFVLAVLASPFKSKSRLEAENAALRHQLIVLRRKVGGRPQLTNGDRWFFIQLYRWFPSILEALTIIRPETLVRWHRVGFRFYWCWKSRTRGGRPQIETDLRGLIRRMSIENPVCTENPIRVYRAIESANLAQWSRSSASFWPYWLRHSSRRAGLRRRMQRSGNN